MTSTTKSIMIFRIGEQLFGYSTKHVSETINIEKIFEVPLTSDTTKGLINFRNNVIGIIDMGVLLWNQSTESDVVVIVEKNEAQVGMLVDDVKGVSNILESELKDIEHISLEDINDDYLEAYFDYNGELVLMVNIDSIMTHKAKSLSKRNVSTLGESEQREAKIALNQKGYILFQIAQEWYAIEVKSIHEIVTYPEHMTALPRSEKYIKGAFKLRDDSVILADLPELLEIEDTNRRQRIVLVKHDDKMVGLSIDNVRELKWIAESDLLKINREDTVQKGMLSLDDGTRMALLLDVEKVIHMMSKAIEGNSESKLTQKQELNVVKNENLKTYIQFSVGSVNMALPVKTIKEVVELGDIKSLPKAAEYLIGMMNLRNTTLVVVSLANRLGIKSQMQRSDQRLVVLDGQPIGFIVDDLKGILHIDVSHISSPDESIDLEENFIESIIRKDDGDVVFVLNNDVVTKHTDVDKLMNRKSVATRAKPTKTTRTRRTTKKKEPVAEKLAAKTNSSRKKPVSDKTAQNSEK